jgi:hypothetical protein
MRTDAPPTVRQVWALAAVLCQCAGEEFPKSQRDASELIERLRLEQGHPAPRVDDTPRRLRGSRSGTKRLARAIAVEVAKEVR